MVVKGLICRCKETVTPRKGEVKGASEMNSLEKKDHQKIQEKFLPFGRGGGSFGLAHWHC